MERPVRESPPLQDEVVQAWRAERQVQVRLSPKAVDDLIEAYLGGTPCARLAERFGVNESTVFSHLKRRGVERRPFRKLCGERLEHAKALYATGLSLRSVSSELGLSKEAVRSGLVSAGVEIRSRGTKRI